MGKIILGVILVIGLMFFIFSGDNKPKTESEQVTIELDNR